jgi:hypothetical protein
MLQDPGHSEYDSDRAKGGAGGKGGRDRYIINLSIIYYMLHVVCIFEY